MTARVCDEKSFYPDLFLGFRSAFLFPKTELFLVTLLFSECLVRLDRAILHENIQAYKQAAPE